MRFHEPQRYEKDERGVAGVGASADSCPWRGSAALQLTWNREETISADGYQ